MNITFLSELITNFVPTELQLLKSSENQEHQTLSAYLSIMESHKINLKFGRDVPNESSRATFKYKSHTCYCCRVI